MDESPQWYYVKNWWKFQHYKDRNPPWIKLHKSILHDPAVQSLRIEDRWRLINIWVLASEHEGSLPGAKAELRRSLGVATHYQALNVLARIESRGLISQQDIRGDKPDRASKVLHRDREETYKEEKKEQKLRASPLQSSPFWQGKLLVVSEQTHESVKRAFPTIEVESEYAKADAWMIAHPGKRKGTAAFVLRWIQNAESYKESRSVSGGNGRGPQQQEIHLPPIKGHSNAAKPPLV